MCLGFDARASAPYMDDMTPRSIIRMGHPTLARPADPVADPTGQEVRDLIADMEAAMRLAGGVGLAAPQIAESLRVIVFEVPARRAGEADDAGPIELTALINPSFEVLDATIELGWEGCLSIPGLRGEVPRPARIRYTGIGRDGTVIERTASGFHARVVQHEIDHLYGVLYLERMTDMRRIGFTQEMLEFGAPAQDLHTQDLTGPEPTSQEPTSGEADD